MSLWSKPIEAITFDDIDAFCKCQHPEGPRLDYKREIPKHIDRLIAAFANTIGGLILLGVDADKHSNTPIWPPNQGMCDEIGILEKLGQIVESRIHPFVATEVSSVLPNRYLPGKVVILIRIPESRFAPHATDDRRHVYVYERVDSRNDPIGLANVDRIDHLLDRRRRIISQREADIQASLDRAIRTLTKSACPIRWTAMSPIYPDSAIITRDQAIAALGSGVPRNCTLSTFQKVPDGAFGLFRGPLRSPKSSDAFSAITIRTNGIVVCLEYCREVLYDNATFFSSSDASSNLESEQRIWIDANACRDFMDRSLSCAKFALNCAEHAVNELVCSFGIFNAFAAKAWDPMRSTKSEFGFPDESYRHGIVVQKDSINHPQPIVDELIADFVDSFHASARSH